MGNPLATEIGKELAKDRKFNEILEREKEKVNGNENGKKKSKGREVIKSFL